MTIRIIFDDTVAVPQALRGVVRVDRFGSIVYRRRTLARAMEDAAKRAGIGSITHICAPQDWLDLRDRLLADDLPGMFLVCPSNIVSGSGDDALAVFLQQILYSPGGLFVPIRGAKNWTGWTLMSARLLQQYMEKREDDVASFFEVHGPEFAPVKNRIELFDVSDERALLDYLSGTFDVRHFNAIERDGYFITKRSSDAKKLRREYEYFDLLPPRMQIFFVRPFDFSEDGDSASYRMERVFVPDMAVQWLQGGYEPADFDRFLDHVFHFLSLRDEREVVRPVAIEKQSSLYVSKVLDRIRELKELPSYSALAPLFESACGGLDQLVQRYLRLFERRRNRFPLNKLVIGHGDLCFSNILYSKINQYMRFVDARGASNAEDIYTDPYYDVAKLSHSVLGNYDFINHDMFDIQVAEDLALKLKPDRAVDPWVRALFADRLERAGFDLELTRLCEASLFISMLPLHIDRPRTVLGFVLTAVSILDELE